MTLVFAMDSNSNSLEIWPKIEIDSEGEAAKRDRMTWHSENTMKLIEVLEKECRELWDLKHPLNRDRTARQAKQEYLANMFGTTAEEIKKKIHNLRTQLNNELRKIKRRQSITTPTGSYGVLLHCSPSASTPLREAETSDILTLPNLSLNDSAPRPKCVSVWVTSGAGEGNSGSGWEYFDALSFLTRTSLGDPLENVEGVNLALAEFQADEEEEFGLAARAHSMTSSPPARGRGRIRVAASAPPPLPPNPLLWPEEAVPRLRPGMNADECQIFGDFVASELRTLRSDETRKKLKRMIQKAILQVGEEEDVNIISG